MENESEILLVLKEAVQTALYEAANEEIKKHREQFERAMLRAKREMVAKIVNHIQVSASHDIPSGEYVIQIRLNGGKQDGE